LRISACTETSSAETGSSATISFAAEREGPRDAHALPLAAGQFARQALAKLAARPYLAAAVRERGPALAAVGADAVETKRLLENGADALARIEAGIGVLEHQLNVAPQRPEAAHAGMGDVRPVEAQRAFGRLKQADDAARQRGLAAAGFADEAKGLAGHHIEADVIDGVHAACAAERAAGEDLAQPVDLDQRRAAHAAPRPAVEASPARPSSDSQQR
jgi:hypothetical protein